MEWPPHCSAFAIHGSSRDCIKAWLSLVMNVASFPEKNGPWMQSDRALGSTRPFTGLRTGQGQSPSSAACQRPRNSGLSQSHAASPVHQALRVPHANNPAGRTWLEQLHSPDEQTETCRKRAV